jgi:hypothetical protein
MIINNNKFNNEKKALNIKTNILIKQQNNTKKFNTGYDNYFEIIRSVYIFYFHSIYLFTKLLFLKIY